LSDKDVNAFRDRLCREAERLFAAHGPHAVTMRQLAAALGVSAMTPYSYFTDKDAILAAVRAAAFTRFAEALEAARASAAGDALAAAAAVGNAYVHFALHERAAYTLMFDLVQPTEAAHPALEAAATRARATMTAYVEDLIAAGLLRGDPVLIGHVFWASMHGVIMLELAGKLAPGVDPGVLRAQAFAALFRGLG